MTLELTSASLPVRRLLRDYQRSLTTHQSVGDAGVRLMRVSRVAWTEHQALLADPLKPDPLSDVEHAYRTLEDVVDYVATTPGNVAIDLTNKPGGERSKAERVIADVDVAQAHLIRVDAGFDTLLEVEQMREQARWSRRLRARVRDARRRASARLARRP